MTVGFGFLIALDEPFVRNGFAMIPKGSAATIVFAQPTAVAVRTQLDTVADIPALSND